MKNSYPAGDSFLVSRPWGLPMTLIKLAGTVIHLIAAYGSVETLKLDTWRTLEPFVLRSSEINLVTKSFSFPTTVGKILAISGASGLRS